MNFRATDYNTLRGATEAWAAVLPFQTDRGRELASRLMMMGAALFYVRLVSIMHGKAEPETDAKSILALSEVHNAAIELLGANLPAIEEIVNAKPADL